MVTARETRRNGSRPSGLKKWRQKLDGILLPLAGILGFLIIWQIFSSSGATRLPGPLSLFTEERTRELLLYPFLDRGGLDKGLFWQTIASLTRVAQGFSIAAIIGISVGIQSLVNSRPPAGRPYGRAPNALDA